jgi:DNA-binding HxlR family transcriptional regulator
MIVFGMSEHHAHICLCPLKGIIDVISKKWTLLIVNAIGNNGKLRFNELMKELQGISPKTLSDTLKELQVQGVVERKSFAEIPPRVEYLLTRDGVELRKAVVPLLEWAATRNGVGKNRCVPDYRKIRAHTLRKAT